MTIKESRFISLLKKHPVAFTAIGCFLVLVTTGMQLDNDKVTFGLMLAGYAAVIVYGLYLRRRGMLSEDAVIVLIFVIGFWLKLCYNLYTDLSERQDDLGVFKEGDYNDWHAGYLLYVKDFFRIPDFDIRNRGQYYHPPFHYFVDAVFMRIYELFLPKGTHNYEAWQALSLFWAQLTTVMVYKNLKLLGIKTESRTSAALVLSAFPMFILFSASLNNDILSILLYFTGFYYGVLWFREGKYKNIVISALAVGFGMMTKLAVGVIAFPLGFLFVVKFMKDLISNKTEHRGKRTFLQLVIFAVTAAPLGLWFQVHNLIKFGVPINYVLPATSEYQDISRFTPVQRLFDFYGFPIEDFYLNLGSDGTQDYNIFITQVKTCLFGGENCRDDFLMSMTGYWLLLIFLVLLVLVAAGMIYTAGTLSRRGKFWEELAMFVMFATETVSVVVFAIKYPHICSQDFRYSTPFILCCTFFLLRAGEFELPFYRKTFPHKLVKGIALAFFIMSVVYYSILWTYVKGEVIVVAPTW